MFEDETGCRHFYLSFWTVCGRDAIRVSPVPPVLLIVVPESGIYFFSFVFICLRMNNYGSPETGT